MSSKNSCPREFSISGFVATINEVKYGGVMLILSTSFSFNLLQAHTKDDI